MRIKVECEVELPALGKTVSREEIDSWVKYNLNEIGGLSMSNPLVEHDLDAVFGTTDWHTNW